MVSLLTKCGGDLNVLIEFGLFIEVLFYGHFGKPLNNDLTFNNERWTKERIEMSIWNGIVDYVRVARKKTKVTITKTPNREELLLLLSKKTWCKNEVLAKWAADHAVWQFSMEILPNL